MIAETTTLAELRALPLAEVIAALVPAPAPALSRRYGPFGNLWFRPMDFPAVGSVVPGHSHNYDHVTFLSRGSVSVRFTMPDGQRGERVYNAPAVILIRKEVIHEFTALAPDTRADCIYALRDLASGEVVDHWDGGLEAYQ